MTLKASALNFALPNNESTVIGELKDTETVNGDTLPLLGRRYEMGIVELLEANPDFKMDETFTSGQKVILPTMFILPNAAHQGLVINLSELRLYFYRPNSREVMTFPVGVGRQNWDSPMGGSYIVRKKADPTWTPTAHIREHSLELGIDLPKSVLPGPENPLGPYALYTNVYAILIHGSNDASGIGRRSSSGCIRMQPEAIESFFDLIPVNMSVTFVDEPIKTGWLENDFYLEVHVPLEEDAQQPLSVVKEKMHQLVDAAIVKRPAKIDWDAADKAVEERRGYPIKIGEGTEPVPQVIAATNPAALVKVKAVKKQHKIKP